HNNTMDFISGKEHLYYLLKKDELTEEMEDAIGNISTYFSFIQFFLMCYLIKIFTVKNAQGTASADIITERATKLLVSLVAIAIFRFLKACVLFLKWLYRRCCTSDVNACENV
ncbi:11795_t:CDS:1, partial [Ambispora gerdemannii]